MATKRRFDALRELILRGLLTGQKTVNQLSKDVGINWRTVDKHLIHLIGMGYLSFLGLRFQQSDHDPEGRCKPRGGATGTANGITQE